jgi:hypothetical protein
MTGTHGPNASGDEQSNQPQTRAVAVPRNPPSYRATSRFQQRLKERVPEYLHDSLPGQLIEDGRVNRAGEYPPGAGTGKSTPVAFSDEIGGETWTLIVALQPRALTVYRGPPSESPETADSDREVTT